VSVAWLFNDSDLRIKNPLSLEAVPKGNANPVSEPTARNGQQNP
jgi:hypothetical protein